jgi:type I restriction enzyme M protein
MALPKDVHGSTGKSLTLTDIASSAEVRVSAVSNWRKRHPDFPQSAVAAGRELFAEDEVALWLGKRKIPRNGLQHDEEPGTTYRDRFARNRSTSVPVPQAVPSTLQGDAPSDWMSRLWQIMSRLRSDLEFVAALDFLLVMLYVRAVDPDLWRAASAQGSWSAVDGILRDGLLWNPNVPPLPAVASDSFGGRQLMEAIKAIGEIDLDSAGLVALFDALMERVNRDLGRHGGHFTPSSVVRCVAGLLNPQSGDSVYDPSCGSGELLVAAAERGAKPLFGQAMNGRSLRMAFLNLSIHGKDAELKIGEPTIAEGVFAVKGFDLALSNPPFNITLPEGVSEENRELWPFGAPGRGGANFAWLQLAFNSLRPGGRAAVIMPNATLFEGGRSAEVRSKMIKAGVVDGIVALPAGLFAHTPIPVSIWLVSRSKESDSESSGVLFIDAASMGDRSGGSQRILREDELAKIVQVYREWLDTGRSGNVDYVTGFARSVDVEEIRQNNYELQPQLYLSNDNANDSLVDLPSAKVGSLQLELREVTKLITQARYNIDTGLQALLEGHSVTSRAVNLGDICDIKVGPGAVDRERGRTVPGWAPLLLPRNIKRGILDHEELDTVDPEVSAKLVTYKLQPGDIVCARSGTLGRHGLVRETEDGWLLGPSCMRLRITRSDVSPDYLVHYMNSPFAHRWISSRAGGSVIPNIATSRLRELLIPLPSVPLQREIVTMLDSIDAQIQQYERGVSTMHKLRDLVLPAVVNRDLGLE